MRVRMVTTNRVLWALVLPVLALLLVASPSVAQAQYATAIGYEVAEHLKFKGGAGEPNDFRIRLAKATLLGFIIQADLADDRNPFVQGGFFDVDARSFVKATGTGPIVATFNTLEGSTSVSTMEVVATGSLKGELDLRPLMQIPPQPFAPVNGSWKAHGRRGTFNGVFLVPFPGAAIGFPALEFVYPLGPAGPGGCMSGNIVTPGGGQYFCQVTEDEILLGFPLTKAELILFRD